MITLHADPSADSGGDGTTSALSSGGGTHAYAGCGPAIVALEASGPNARGDAVTLKLHNALGVADTDGAGTMNQFDVATTATRYLQIEGASPLTGVFDQSIHYFEFTNRNGVYNNVTPHLRLKNLQIRMISNDGGGHIGCKTLNANLVSADIDQRIDGMILECTGSDKTGSLAYNPRPDSGTVAVATNENMLAYGWFMGYVADDYCEFQNCGAYDNEYGFVDNGGVPLVHNCASHHNSNQNWAGGTYDAGSSNNAGDSGDTPPGADPSTGAPAFARRGHHNYLHLTGDTVLKNLGLADPLGTGSTADMRGFTRATWDIGPFEAVTASVALTGTAAASIDEADVQAGGETLLLTQTNDTLVPAKLYPEFLIATTKGTAAADSGGGGGGRTGDGDLTCTFPSGFVKHAGFFAVMWVYHDQGDSSTPTDWTEIAGSPFGSGTEKLCVFVKTLVGGEADPVTTVSGSGAGVSHCANMLIFFNGQLGAIGAASQGTGTPMTAAEVTTTDLRSIVVALSGRGDNENASGQTFAASATGVTEYADGGTAAGNDSQCSAAGKRIDTATGSGAASSTTAITDPWVSVQLEIKAVTPFATARAALTTGVDSAQAEGAGWDARRTTILPVTAWTRTSPKLLTGLFVADATYDITAQETVTATVPAAMANGAVAVVASPTFTIDLAGGGGATVAMEWQAPSVQLHNHAITSIINMHATTPQAVPTWPTQGAYVIQPRVTDVQLHPYLRVQEHYLRATSPLPVPYLPTTPTRVTNTFDWVSLQPEVMWTDG